MIFQKAGVFVLINTFVLCFHFTFAQDTTLTKPDTVFYRFCKEDGFEALFKIDYSLIDTALHGFQRYEPVLFAATLGNTGKAYSNLFFTPVIKKGFNLGEHAYRAYLPQKDEVYYYNVSSPYSDLNYVMGSNKEQILKVVHSQNVNKQLNFALNFNIINSIGAYRRQNTDVSNFVISGNYKSKNNRYRIIGNIMSNKWFNYENGGIADMSIFTNQLLDRADQFDVNLNQAQNKAKENGVYLKQYLNFNKKTTTDSTHVDALYNTRLSHAFQYKRTSLIYMDEEPLAGYYTHILFDSIYTCDSVFVDFLSNDFRITQVFARNKTQQAVLYAEAGIEHQYALYKNYITNFIDSLVPVRKKTDIINQYIVKGALNFNPSLSIKSSFDAYTVLNGYNKGDVGMKAQAFIQFDTHQSLLFTASVDNIETGYHQKNFISNHYYYNYTFDKTNFINLSIAHDYKGVKTSLRAYQVYNYITYFYDAKPKQYNKYVHVLEFTLEKRFKIRNFYNDNFIAIQQSTNNNIIPLPLLINRHSFYWATPMFKKALNAQIGVDAYYFSSYYGMTYMPVSRQFYLQKNSLTGNNAFFDFFVNLQIKRANIFAKLTHLNQGLMGYDYFSVPNYPLQNRAFKVGVSWRFYD